MILKILYIHNTQVDSAKANLIQVISMCNAFRENNISIDLALPEPKKKISNINDFISIKFGISVKFNVIFFKRYSKNRIIEKYFGIKSIEEIIKKSDADYVFTRLPKFIALVLKHNKRLIFESHNNKLHNKYKIIDWYWKRKILSKIKDDNFTTFISISQNLTNYWSEIGVPKNKQLSLHDGISKNFFKDIISKQSSRKELSISTEEKIVMYIGSLYPDREIENILNAAKITPELVFYIIGGPKEYSDYYKEMAMKMNLSNVKLLGHIPHVEVPKYLSTADYLLGLWSKKVPTINYCSPLKVFEYMASGNIVIVHDFPTIREVLIEGENALFVNPNSKDSLGEVLKKAQNTDLAQLGMNSKKLVYENYTWGKRASLIIKHLDNL